MFGKKTQQTMLNSVDDSRSISYDFCLRKSRGYGDESYRTVEYVLYDKLREEVMIPRLDEHLSKLFSGAIDDGNGDMLDALIFGAAREATPDLGRQHYDHMDMLRRLIIKSKANREDILKIKEERKKERDVLRADFDKLCDLFAKCEEV